MRQGKQARKATSTMKPQVVKYFTVAVGKARRESRPPSHDGEYVTIYYSGIDSKLIAENNAGVFSLDDFGADDNQELDAECKAVREEAYGRALRDKGRVCRQAGSEAIKKMIKLGWITRDQVNGNQIFQWERI